MRIERFEDIEAWQLARELTCKVYELKKKPRFARDFGLKGQIQDAAGSSIHNIAEGFDSETNPEPRTSEPVKSLPSYYPTPK
jgi:four helix bundle protein